MGGRGSNGGVSAGGAKGGMTLPGNDKIEFEGTLRYGKKDAALSPGERKTMEAWEARRVKNKIEYAYACDKDGNPVGPEVKGGKGSVRTPLRYHYQEGGTFSHIHPRGPGELGGTFSNQDLFNLANSTGQTMRAAAKEGTYTISKTSTFDRDGFKKYIRECDIKFSKSYTNVALDLAQKYTDKSISYDEYVSQSNRAFNTALVELHNMYLSGQSKYGYYYALEKR